MQQQIQQQEKSLKQQQLRTIVWQNGKLSIEFPTEELHAVLDDPQVLVWLDIEGDCSLSQDMLCNVFKLEHITVRTMCEERERAKFVDSDNYYYLVVHGLEFDTATDEANTPKLDIVFAKNFIITNHRESLAWLDSVLETAKKNDPEEHIMSRGMPFLLLAHLPHQAIFVPDAPRHQSASRGCQCADCTHRETNSC